MARGLDSFFSAATTESAVSRPVRVLGGWHIFDLHREASRFRLDLDAVNVAGHAGVGPDFDGRAVRSDPGKRQSRRHIDVGRKPAGRLARSAGENAFRLGQFGDVDGVLLEIGRAQEAPRRLARNHMHARDAALRGGGDRIETQQCPGGNKDASAVPACQVHQVEIVEERSATQDHDETAASEGRLGQLAQQCRWRALDDDVGRFAESCQRHHRRRPGEARHRRLRARTVAGRYRGEGQPVDPAVEVPSNDFADRT